jgi:bifunctional non-homologous end joining protein LigD
MPGILNQLQSIEIKKNPFANEVNEEGRIHWVQPQLVAEFKYTKTTKKGSIRHPAIFLGFRPDKDPEEVVLELPVSTHNHQSPAQRKMESNPSALPDEGWEAVEKKQITSKEEINVEGHTITLTNIEQELWKGITKAHLIAYYNSMAGYLLPYLEDRPLGLNISPNGPFKDSVFIRGLEGHYPSWARVFTTDRKHKKRGKSNTIDWLVCNDLATLMYMINIDCIDLHPWCSKVGSPNYPDYISIDLDPSDDDFSKVIETALAAKELFSKFKLTSFVKTSGKTGMHIFVPCTGIAFGEARSIAENICNQIQALVPYITTTETSISARGDKLYIDPSQNDYGDRLAAPYCVRAYKLPTVSTPLDWKEVARRLDPTDYTIHTITKRIEKKGDLWKDLFSKKVRAANAKILKSFL